MKKHGTTYRVLAACVFATMLLLVSDSWARKGPFYEDSLPARMTHKLLRGWGNFMFGWCEIPRHIHIAIEDVDPFTGTCIGIAKGTVWGVVRSSVGLWEVLTFPIPAPPSYRAVVKPEFIWMDLFE